MVDVAAPALSLLGLQMRTQMFKERQAYSSCTRGG